MTPVIVVAALWLLFAGSHVVLGIAPIRGPLVRRLGELGFTLVFYVVAAASFAALVTYYTAHRFEGPPGLGLANNAALRWLLMVVVASGVAFMMPGLRDYPRLPSALFGQPIRTPRGMERVTRHPFFAGMALFALAHAVLAVHLVGTVCFGALALFTVAGAIHQDRKLLARRGEAYAEYLAQTSAVPFAAIGAGRQHLAWRELPLGMLAAGVVVALALRYWHAALLADGGIWFIVVFLAGALIAGLNAWRRSHRVGAAPPPSVGHPAHERAVSQ